MKKIIIPFIFSLLLIPTALAQVQNTSTFCVDNSTLNSITSVQIQIGSNPPRIITSELNQTCLYGCDTDNNQCNPNPFWSMIIFLGLIIAVIVVVIIFVRRI